MIAPTFDEVHERAPKEPAACGDTWTFNGAFEEGDLLAQC
jgi:hypothetical protein